MMHSKAPKRVWDFCAVYAAELQTLTAHPLYSLHGRTPQELVTRNTPDISEYLDFDWYQLVWYYDAAAFPEDKHLIGCQLGVAN